MDNSERFHRIESVLEGDGIYNLDPEDILSNVVDLLTDIRHYCDWLFDEGVFDRALSLSEMHFQAEIAEEDAK